MRLLVGVVAAALLAMAPAGGALARGISKAEIARALSSEGYSVQDFQADKLAVTVGDYTIVVVVDGPDADVSYFTWFPSLSINQLGHEFLTKFNSEVKFGRAYVDSDGDIAIQMDRNSAGGVSIENIKSDFDVFVLLASKFLSDVENRVSA
ncbi:MAG: YbjN domain-containing protein [Parvularculaceae bacterium]